MGGTLVFKTEEVKPLVEHALASKEWSMGYETESEPAPALFLVKDSGVYLMSNGLPRQKSEGKPPLLVAYAKGHDPQKGDTWEADRAVMGGDDGTETLDVAAFKKIVDSGKKTFKIKVTSRNLSIIA